MYGGEQMQTSIKGCKDTLRSKMRENKDADSVHKYSASLKIVQSGYDFLTFNST